jgi:2,4-didehydro-3-deoxy-L-rhamnonate hydrolase
MTRGRASLSSMRFRRLGEVGAETPVVEVDAGTFSLAPLTRDLDGAFWVDGVARTRAALDAGELPPLDPTGLRVGAPIATPQAILCIGQNYAAHAAESGSTPPEHPMLFFKHPNTLAGPDDDIPYPADATQLDWEVELAVVIGRRLHRASSVHEALDAVAGWSVANDLSERVWQRQRGGGQFGKGKSSPGFCPLGPAVVPVDELDPGALRLWSRVNGEPRQDSTTADMVFPVGEILRDLSQYLALSPGDLVITGTPEGVALGGRFPFLAPGDLMEVGIDGIGAHRAHVR